MSVELARAHIVAQERLRKITGQGVALAWQDLLGYDEEHVAPFLRRVVPFVQSSQRQSVALTGAFLAQAVGRRAIAVNAPDIIAAARNGTPPTDVYRRPFVTVWAALGAGTQWDAAVAKGLARASSAAQTDVQLAMRGTLRAVGDADDQILGYQRVPDGGACAFCQLVSGQRYRTGDLMPIHNHCGCGVEVITRENRGDFAGKPANTLPPDDVRASVHEHGELGPVLTNAEHSFTAEEALT